MINSTLGLISPRLATVRPWQTDDGQTNGRTITATTTRPLLKYGRLKWRASGRRFWAQFMLLHATFLSTCCQQIYHKWSKSSSSGILALNLMSRWRLVESVNAINRQQSLSDRQALSTTRQLGVSSRHLGDSSVGRLSRLIYDQYRSIRVLRRQPKLHCSELLSICCVDFWFFCGPVVGLQAFVQCV